MSGDNYQVVIADFKKKLMKFHSLSVKNMVGGPLDVLIGSYGIITHPPTHAGAPTPPPKKGWITKLVATLNAGQSWSGSPKDVPEFSQQDGEWLILRPKESDVGYRIENHRASFVYFKKMTPQVFPMQGATVIVDAIIDAFSSRDSIISPNEQDVVYYFVIG